MSLPTPIGSINPAAPEAAIASLQPLLGDRLSTAPAVRERHGKDAFYHPCMPPDAVAFPRSTQEVSEIVRVCARHKVPLIPFGGGTSFLITRAIGDYRPSSLIDFDPGREVEPEAIWSQPLRRGGNKRASLPTMRWLYGTIRDKIAARDRNKPAAQ